MPEPEDVAKAIQQAGGARNVMQNIGQASQAINNTAHVNIQKGLGAIEWPAAAMFGSKVLAPIEIAKRVIRYSGDGGLYRLGNDISSAPRILDGIAGITQKVDDRIGNGARLIFTGASSQSRKANDE
jgi:hypothetical protein